ncbi:MAG TPA: preprotein translocase subunit SecE [Elusimicrobia bacterium]|nr:preprotein translocase subunit SecE [Elusimicrobiota bacterium]
MLNPTQFAREAYTELKKSTWLTRQQAVGSTVVVLVLIFIVAGYISGVDFILSVVMGALLGR